MPYGKTRAIDAVFCNLLENHEIADIMWDATKE
jgi:hypothetical protein